MIVFGSWYFVLGIWYLVRCAALDLLLFRRSAGFADHGFQLLSADG
jgi:hypothetical protein